MNCLIKHLASDREREYLYILADNPYLYFPVVPRHALKAEQVASCIAEQERMMEQERMLRWWSWDGAGEDVEVVSWDGASEDVEVGRGKQRRFQSS